MLQDDWVSYVPEILVCAHCGTSFSHPEGLAKVSVLGVAVCTRECAEDFDKEYQSWLKHNNRKDWK